MFHKLYEDRILKQQFTHQPLSQEISLFRIYRSNDINCDFIDLIDTYRAWLAYYKKFIDI